MTREILKYAGIGLLIVLVAVAVILFLNRGAHVELKGAVQKVRIQGMADKSCVVIVDFRFVNPSDYPFVVRDANLLLEDIDGNILKGMAVAAGDAAKLFDYYPLLGQQFNEVLVVRDRVEPKESLDRMIAARFEVPDSTADLRRRLIIRIEDVDGGVSEITEDREGSGS